MDWTYSIFILQYKTRQKVCKRQTRCLSFYVHGPGLIVGCPSCSAGIYVGCYIDGPVPLISVPLHTLGRKCTECWIEVCLCVHSNHDILKDTAGPIPSNLTTLMRTWLTFTAHSRDHSIECRWTGHTQYLYFSIQNWQKVCKRQKRGLSLYVHGPGLIVGCPSCSAGIYVE